MESGDFKNYWAQYYKNGVAPEEPSGFAQYIMEQYASEHESLVELGCGNGRDARFFARKGLSVVAFDQCAPENDERADASGSNLVYATGDFTDLSDVTDSYDLVYSRFTLHSVSAEGQARTLAWSARNLMPGGRLCIETRGQKNELYKKGKVVSGEQDAFIHNDHYRRFVDFDKFVNEIESNELTVVEASEQTGYAPFQDTDYHFIRVIAEK